MISYISELDSKRFGFKIAKIDFFELSPEIVVQNLRKVDVKLIIARVACEKIELINRLEKLSFETMDFQVTYKKYLKNLSFDEDNIDSAFTVREAKNSDIETLKIIAQESFNHYGHYYADKRLDKTKCNEVYVDWVGRSVIDKEVADIVFVAERAEEVVGFLSFKIKRDETSYASGVQGAVAKKFRNQNVFRLLANRGLKWGSELNLNWEEHNVLLTNYPVNRSFISLGFIPDKSFITLHHWLD